MSRDQSTILSVTGMTCGACVRHVEAALRGLLGVSDVKVALQEGEARITHAPERAPLRALLEAIRGAGYDAVPTAAESMETKL